MLILREMVSAEGIESANERKFNNIQGHGWHPRPRLCFYSDECKSEPLTGLDPEGVMIFQVYVHFDVFLRLSRSEMSPAFVLVLGFIKAFSFL